MKLIGTNIERDTSGTITLIPQDKEDLFTLYNLIQVHDTITLKTIRNVTKGAKNKVEKVLLKLSIGIQSIDFEPSDESMRIRGQTTDAYEDVPIHSYHTAEIQYNFPFTLYKDNWDSLHLEVIHKACDIEEKAEVGAVVLQEGVAHICLITDNITVLRQKVEKSIPKKQRGDSSKHDKALEKFYKDCVESVQRSLNLLKLKAIIIASPGFYAQNLFDKLFNSFTLENNKELLQTKPKFLVTHCSSGFLQSLDECLKNPEVQHQLQDTKFAKDSIILDEFFKHLNEDNCKAWYGPKEVVKACDMGAVKNLLITDSLFRSDDVRTRKHYLDLSDSVKASGGEVTILSSLHDSGKQLDQITGVAVICKFPVFDLDESDNDDDNNDDDDERDDN